LAHRRPRGPGPRPAAEGEWFSVTALHALVNPNNARGPGRRSAVGTASPPIDTALSLFPTESVENAVRLPLEDRPPRGRTAGDPPSLPRRPPLPQPPSPVRAWDGGGTPLPDPRPPPCARGVEGRPRSRHPDTSII
jgi:hypothetical protein